ncbi:MAG: hypothetical protein GF311_17730 [Candidatus Lokiarchaeota archaeon]|nr:hypothetical protein [Candidatus Lokiarchaeota archaeon]
MILTLPYFNLIVIYETPLGESSIAFFGYEIYLVFGVIEIILLLISLILFDSSRSRSGMIIGGTGIILRIINYIYMSYFILFGWRNNINENEIIRTISILIGYPLYISIFSFILIFSSLIGLFKLEFKQSKVDWFHVKKSIFELSTRFPRLKIKEISEETNQNQDLIIKIVKNMIESNEIQAEYFSSTKTVAFDQQSHFDKIDDLLDDYTDKEKNNIYKKD